MRTKKGLATLGLLGITVISAFQYLLMDNVPDSFSTLAFVFITNLVGLLLLAVVEFKKFKLFNRRLLLKGLLLGGELVCYNIFLRLGSKNIDSVVMSSVLAMYFIFVTPMLLLLRKKVSFRSAIASALAVIALLLMFEADTYTFFKSANIVYLLLTDLIFAAYVITVSIVCQDEDSAALTISQMTFSCLISGVCWLFCLLRGITKFQIPSKPSFWVSILFFAIFIRVIYALVQITCQKYIPPITTSMLFSFEIILTLIANPFLSILLNREYSPATSYQILGCGFFVIAILIVDDTIMSRFGYNDMDEKFYTDDKGKHLQSSVSKKLVNMTLGITITALLISSVICVYSIQSVRRVAVENSRDLGKTAAKKSENALQDELETKMTNMVSDKASLIAEKLEAYEQSAQYAADYAATLLDHPDNYPSKEVNYPLQKDVNKVAMQRCLANKDIKYTDVQAENAVLGNMEAVFAPILEKQKYISTIYLGTSDGLLLSYDDNEEDRKVGEENYYEFRESDWYKLAEEKKKVSFTEAYQDYYGRGLMITCVAPVFDKDGTFRGVLGLDILMENMDMSMVNNGIEDPNRAVLVSDEGYLIASKDLSEKESGNATIYDYNFSGSENALKEAADEILSKKDGLTVVGSGDDAIYVSHAYIKNADWIMCLISPVSDITIPAVGIRDSINSNTQLVETFVEDSIKKTVNNCLVLFALIILIVTALIGHLSNKISQPLVQLEEDVLSISQGNLDLRTKVSTNDEIGSLARAFNYMTQSLQKYIQDLKEATVREERIASELSVATKIQSDMLPAEFPETGVFRLYATMTPAKEVGGDFYDFFWLDENHFAMIIGDVSGKGVPAALFMVRAKTLLKDEVMQGCQPAEAMYLANNELCQNNDENLFVTVWLSIMDIRNGNIVAANAGHEYPIIRKPEGKFEILRDRHAMPLGGMEGIRFKEYEMQIEAGGSLYVYTDGVTEATDANNEMFGMNRTLEALNVNPDAEPKEYLASVMEQIHVFVKDAPQFDDITMLGMQYNGIEK